MGFGGGPKFFFLGVPLGGVFRLKLETWLLVLDKYGVFGVTLSSFLFGSFGRGVWIEIRNMFPSP